MRIRFEIDVEDIIAFNVFHCENSPMWRRQRLILSLIPSALAALVVIIYVVILVLDWGNNFVAWAATVLLTGVLAAITIPSFFFLRWSVTRNLINTVRKLLAEGGNRSILGWCELELVDHRLVVDKELMSTTYNLRAIEKIVGNDQYTFVYISSIQALPIPMNLYPEEEYRQFVAELIAAWEDRDAAPPRPRMEPRPDVRIVER